MRQAPFEAAHTPEWEAFDQFLDTPKKPPFDPAEMPARFRRICQHLALAAERRYSAELVDRLNGLALRGHHALYVNRRRDWCARNGAWWWRRRCSFSGRCSA
jgi:hypothetical protein